MQVTSAPTVLACTSGRAQVLFGPLSAWKDVPHDFDRAAERAVELHSGFYVAQLDASEALRLPPEWHSAWRALHPSLLLRCILVDANAEENSPMHVADAHRRRGNDAFAFARYIEATDAYTAAIEALECVDGAAALLAACLANRAAAWLRRRQWARAMEDCNRVLRSGCACLTLASVHTLRLLPGAWMTQLRSKRSSGARRRTRDSETLMRRWLTISAWWNCSPRTRMPLTRCVQLIHAT